MYGYVLSVVLGWLLKWGMDLWWSEATECGGDAVEIGCGGEWETEQTGQERTDGVLFGATDIREKEVWPLSWAEIEAKEAKKEGKVRRRSRCREPFRVWRANVGRRRKRCRKRRRDKGQRMGKKGTYQKGSALGVIDVGTLSLQ
jgi:hypothetical protein